MVDRKPTFFMKLKYYITEVVDKKTKFTVFMILICIILFVILIVISAVTAFFDKNPNILYLTASNGEFSDNVFFEDIEAKNTGILLDLAENDELKECIDNGKIKSQRVFWNIISENNEWKQIINNNSQYQIYLEKKGYSISTIVNFAEEYNKADLGLSGIVIFLAGICIYSILVILLKFRYGFYITIAIFSIFFGIGKISNGVAFFAFYIIIEKLHFLIGLDMFFLMKDNFFAVLLESFMSMTFFDVIIQIVQSNKMKKREEKIKYQYRYIIATLLVQILYLEKNADITQLIILRMPNSFQVDKLREWYSNYSDNLCVKMNIQSKYKTEKGKRRYEILTSYYNESVEVLNFLDFLKDNEKGYYIYHYIEKLKCGRSALMKLGENSLL